MRIIKACILLLLGFQAIGQEADTSYSQIKILYSETFISDASGDEDIQYYKGDVKIFHDSSFMFCDTAVTRLNILDATDNIILIRQDTLQVFGDSLHYDGNRSYAELYGEVALLNGKQKLFSDALYYDIENERVSYRDTALMQSERAQLSSLTGFYDLEADKAHFFGEVVVIDSNLTLRCDTLLYDAAIKRAFFEGPSYITQGDNKIYCEGGYYETESGNAYFEKNTRFYGDSLDSKADFIEYDRLAGKMILTGNAEVQDNESFARAQRIEYLEKDSSIIMEGDGYYKDDDGEVYGDYIYFNNEKGELIITGNGSLYRDEISLSGDSIYYDVTKEAGSSYGNVIFEDTLEQRLLYSDFLLQDSLGNTTAYNKEGRPYIEEQGDADTLFLAADSLYLQQNEQDSVDRMRAYNAVKMYSKGFQGVADSLEYDTVDSLIWFFGNPILWADTTQFTADTIIVKTGDEGIEEVFLRSNAMIGNKLGERFYDQIKGKNIHAVIDSQDIEWMEVKGNAEVIYMLRDDGGAFIGANKTVCSYIEFFFDSGELKDIKFHANPTSNMVPVNQASQAELYLSGFIWEANKRPISLDDILNVKMEEIPVQESDESDTFEEDVNQVLEKLKYVPK